MSKIRLYRTRCVYNILGANPNQYIGIKRTVAPNVKGLHEKPMTRVRTKTVQTKPYRTGSRNK
ncbi:MAG: hypothetical protein J6B98_06760 [Bacilli bacterium]|nr:hypothetical protein [Bacilli bacterium]